MFGHSAFAAESALCFLSGLTANPERFLPMNIRAPRMLKDGRGSSKPGRDALPALNVTCFALSRNIETTATILQFSIALEMRSDLTVGFDVTRKPRSR